MCWEEAASCSGLCLQGGRNQPQQPKTTTTLTLDSAGDCSPQPNPPQLTQAHRPTQARTLPRAPGSWAGEQRPPGPPSFFVWWLPESGVSRPCRHVPGSSLSSWSRSKQVLGPAHLYHAPDSNCPSLSSKSGFTLGFTIH